MSPLPASAVGLAVLLASLSSAWSSDIELIENEGAQCLYAHNALRLVNAAGPLEWDKDLAKGCADYAAKLVEENNLKHSSGPYGENLAMGWGGTPNCASSVYGWYSEYSKHDFTSNNFIPASGHFTAVVWNSTTKVGVGIAHSKTLNRWAVCARYTPPGNMAGAFLANVFPARVTIPTNVQVIEAAKNATPFRMYSSGSALSFWRNGDGGSTLHAWVLRAIPFLTSLAWMLMSRNE